MCEGKKLYFHSFALVYQRFLNLYQERVAMLRTILILLLLFKSGDYISAQGYYFRQYEVEQGLSHNTIFSSMQDSKGFMWFGSKDGLNRFDGRQFKVFRRVPSDSLSLGNNHIYSLFEDKKQNIWIGTVSGLYLYNDRFESFQLVSAERGTVHTITEDSKGHIWYTMGGRIFRLQPETKTNTHENNTYQVSGLYIDTNDDVWYGTPGTLNHYQRGTGKSDRYTLHIGSARPLSQVQSIVACGDNELLIGTNKLGLKSFNLTNKVFNEIIRFTENNIPLYVRDIKQSGANEFWLGTEAGIYIYNQETKSVIHLNKSFTNPYSISDNAVYTICKDKEGGIWAGTYFGGLNYFARQYTSFEKYMSDNTANTISGNAVREICPDDKGNLWIGTEDNGLNKLEVKSGKFTHFLPEKNSRSISHYNIHGLLFTDNELWIGPFEHGIDVMDTRSGKIIRHYDYGTPGISNNFFLSFCKTRSGDIYAGNAIELLRYKKDTDSFEKIETVTGYGYMHHIMEDRNGGLWISTHNRGLFYYHPASGKKEAFQYDPDGKGISGNKINSTFEDQNGFIWIATGGSGLCRFDPATRQFTVYSHESGLPSDYIFNVLEDDQQQLWIATSRGLVQMDPRSNRFSLYTTVNGLLSDQFNYSSAYKGPDGRLFFGSVKGLVSFHPGAFQTNDFDAPIYITGVSVQNNPLLITDSQTGYNLSITSQSLITLKHNQNSFSIDFASLSFTAPEMIRYAYKMQGLQHSWTDIGQTGRAYFTDLSPGNYTFEVKAKGNNQEWSRQFATIKVTILAPWWQSNTAYFAYTVAIGFSIIGLLFFFNARMREKNLLRMEQFAHEKDKELYEAKMDFFSEVAHEIKTPLTLISAPLERLLEVPDPTPMVQKQLQTMQRNTKRLLALTNQLLDFRLTESKSYSLEFANINISSLLSDCFNNFRPIAEKKALIFQMETPAEPITAKVDEDAIEKIISNLLSNALKYADKMITVILSKQNTDFKIIFYNDGPAIPEDKKEKIFEPFYTVKQGQKSKGTGIGLALSRNLTALHNGNLTLQSDKERGCSFTVRIPL